MAERSGLSRFSPVSSVCAYGIQPVTEGSAVKKFRDLFYLVLRNLSKYRVKLVSDSALHKTAKTDPRRGLPNFDLRQSREAAVGVAPSLLPHGAATHAAHALPC